MGGSFACPECGNELALRGTSPGRQVRCGWCETWVEVPFLPRAAGYARGRNSKRRRPGWVVWAWSGLGLAALLILVLAAGRTIRTRGRERTERVVAELIASAKEEERAGRSQEALEAIAQAIKEAGKFNPPRPEQLGELQRHRDRLARTAAEAQLETAARGEPAAAIAIYKELLSRVWRDPALEGLERTLRARLEQTRRNWAESDAAAARRAAAEGQPNEALDRCERLVQTIEELPPDIRQPLRTRADALAAGLIESRGLIFHPATGQFTLGSPGSYLADLDAKLNSAFRQRGYLPSRSGSIWKSLWDTKAPFHLAIEVAERQEGSYLQSPNRLSFLSFTMILSRAGGQIWHAGPITARTQPSIPSMSAFMASRIATEPRNGPFERTLYEDARATLLDRISQRLRTLPEYRPLGG